MNIEARSYNRSCSGKH